jgi:hypothetical protein
LVSIFVPGHGREADRYFLKRRKWGRKNDPRSILDIIILVIDWTTKSYDGPTPGGAGRRDEEGRKRGVPTQNVVISNCIVYSGHGGFVVGSEMSGGVRNIGVKHCTFIRTDNGLRFKSTRGRGGVVENIYISDINMINIRQDTILYDLYYMVKNRNIPVPPEDDGTPEFRNVHIKNVACRGAKRALLLQGFPEMTLKKHQPGKCLHRSRNRIILQ